MNEGGPYRWQENAVTVQVNPSVSLAVSIHPIFFLSPPTYLSFFTFHSSFERVVSFSGKTWRSLCYVLTQDQSNQGCVFFFLQTDSSFLSWIVQHCCDLLPQYCYMTISIAKEPLRQGTWLTLIYFGQARAPDGYLRATACGSVCMAWKITGTHW